jgi:spore maturation protein CgeB
MRVLVVGEAYPDSFADNLHSTLRDAGHDVCAVSPFPRWLARHGRARARLRGALPVAPRAALRLQRPVVDAAESFRPDVVLNVDARLSHLVVGELRSVTAAPIAFWFPDSPGGLGRETHLLAGYDAVLLTDTVVVRRYRRVLGINAHFVPEACNPRWHRPFDDAAPGAAGETVLVAGNMYATRYLTVRRLVEAGLNVEVFGPPWAPWLPGDGAVRATYTGRYLARAEKARAFRRAGIVLNTLASHEADGLNCRLFEAAASGALVLTERRDRLDDLFRVPAEVSCYEDHDELVARARQLVALAPAERRRRGDAAAARAHAEHTYAHRFSHIVGLLGRG